MKFCHSLLISPNYVTALHQIESIMICSSLSVAYIKSLGYEIKLYTNSLGKKLLKDIPYDEVIDIDYYDYIPEKCYAQSKIAALELMDEDEIHIDYDVFIKSKTLTDILKTANYDAVVQYVYQVGTNKFESSSNAINYFSIMGLLENCNPYEKEGFNAGILCFKNKELKDCFITAYKDFYKRAQDFTFNVDHSRYILDSYVEEVQGWDIMQNYSVFSLFGNLKYDDSNLSRTMDLANTLGYEHLCGPKTTFLPRLMQELSTVDTKIYKIVENKLKDLTKQIIYSLDNQNEIL